MACVFPKFKWGYVVIILFTAVFLESNSKRQYPSNYSLSYKLLILFHNRGSFRHWDIFSCEFWYF